MKARACDDSASARTDKEDAAAQALADFAASLHALRPSTNMSPFSGVSVPSGAMIAYAACYTALFLSFAIRRLQRRDL